MKGLNQKQPEKTKTRLMKTQTIFIVLTAGASLLAPLVVSAQCGSARILPGGGCCYRAPASAAIPPPAPPGVPGDTAAPDAGAPQATPLAQSTKTILDSYVSIQTALASDSLEAVAQSGNAIVQNVRGDPSKISPPQVAREADKLAKAQDLQSARKAFKSLSQSLIQYVRANHITGLHEAYCPMAKASWLQVGTQINNPYMGRSMPGCGEFKS